MQTRSLRTWAIGWTYAAIAAHLVAGALLPWVAGAAVFDGYHASIDAAFWGGAAPGAARAQQLWWIGLFGPTLQSAALWMGALAYIGARQRSSFAWGALVAGMVLWAPQDMLISLRADCWHHVWLDSFAVLTMLPPLLWLYFTDRAAAAPA